MWIVLPVLWQAAGGHQRTSVVAKFEPRGSPGATALFPCDVVCVIEVTHRNKPREEDDAVEWTEDMFFVQAYDYIKSPGEQHPLVPGAVYVYLTDEFYLFSPDEIMGPALLVPNVTPSRDREPAGFEKKSTPLSGSTVRPHMWWLRKLLS